MPRRRRQGNILSSDQVGSDNPEPTEIELAEVGSYPEEYVDYPDGWKKAYDHAASKNNTVKASILWADSHEVDYLEQAE